MKLDFKPFKTETKCDTKWAQSQTLSPSDTLWHLSGVLVSETEIEKEPSNQAVPKLSGLSGLSVREHEPDQPDIASPGEELN